MIFFLSRSGGGKKARELAVGESVWLTENGARTEYFVVQQGNPDSSIYKDAGASGTWIMRKELGESCTWGTVVANGFYLSRFPSEVQNAFVEVTLPRYWADSVLGGTTSKTAKIHIPGPTELDPTVTSQGGVLVEQAVLQYFAADSNIDRIGYYAGSPAEYWVYDAQRSTTSVSLTYVKTDGSVTVGGKGMSDLAHVRPMMILDPDTQFDASNDFVGL